MMEATEARRQQLSEKAQIFFQLDKEGRRKEIRAFLHWIEENVDNELLEASVDEQFQAVFEICAERAFNSQMILLDSMNDKYKGDPERMPEDYVFPIVEGCTVVAINENGVPIGYVYKPVGKLGGFNTAKVAYQKAVMLKVLEDEGLIDGLSGKNMELARSMGYLRHWGSALNSVETQDDGKVYIGASGVGQNQEYNRRLIDGGTPSDSTNWGLFDAYFATATAMIIEDPTIPDTPHLENDLFIHTMDRN